MSRREVPHAVAPLVAAFWDYEETVHLLPSESSRRHALPRYLRAPAREAATFGALYGAVADGDIVGAAVWLPPDAYPVSLARQLRQAVDLAPTLPWTWRTARESRRGQVANRKVHRGRPPHYWLSTLGVDPTYQGHGVGAALVRPMLAVADERGVPCFLFTATPANVAWYERFGFAPVEEYRPTPTWPKVWAMWREPVATI